MIFHIKKAAACILQPLFFRLATKGSCSGRFRIEVKAKGAFISILPTPVAAERLSSLLFRLATGASLSGRFRLEVKAKDAFISNPPAPVEARRHPSLLLVPHHFLDVAHIYGASFFDYGVD